MNTNQATNNIVAKLLATENISVHRANTKTAYFDIKNRVLVLPMWKDIENIVEQMLICHEVGHALFTKLDEYKAAIDGAKFKNAQAYMNILEDARIEKFMARKFAGINKTMSGGYSILNAKDFFGIKNSNLYTLTLIDRINIHFKLGAYIEVPFTKDERIFIEKTANLESMNDVATLANEIYTYSTENYVSTDYTMFGNEDSQYVLVDGDEEGDFEYGEYPEYDDSDNNVDSDGIDSESDKTGESDSDKDSDKESDEDSEKNTKSDGSEGKSDKKDIPDPITDSEFQKNIESYCDSNIMYKYWTFGKFTYDPVFNYKKVLKNVEESGYTFDDTSHLEYINKFKQDSMVNVNYLVKEFEMRKAATAYKRTTIAKSGTLNTNKLFAYQINNDIFKRISVTKDGKNHGMVFLLDWSGSMYRNIKETLEQLINLVMFCSRAQIKYTVLAFTNDAYNLTGKRHLEWYESDTKNDINVNHANIILAELFSSEMTTNEFSRMINYTLSDKFPLTIDMNGTPLLEALIYINEYIDGFIKKNHIEKFTFVTFTDGASNDFHASIRSRDCDDDHTMKSCKNMYICPVTKIEYTIVSNNVIHNTEMMYTIIKNRYKCNVIGFFLMEAISIRYVDDTIKMNDSKYPHYPIEVRQSMATKLRSDCLVNKFANIPNTAKDAMYIIPASSLKVDDSELAVDTNATAYQISKKFGKFLNIRKTSRVLLNNLLGYIC